MADRAAEGEADAGRLAVLARGIIEQEPLSRIDDETLQPVASLRAPVRLRPGA